MRRVKRLCLCLIIGLCFSLFGCEQTNDLRTVYFSEITAPQSTNYTVKIVFERDKRVNEKYIDIQLRSSVPAAVRAYRENEEETEILFDDTKWNSLTTLFCAAKDQPETEDFKKYDETQSLTYIFRSEKALTLTLRVVAGEKKENASKTGFILTNAKEISDEFKLKID